MCCVLYWTWWRTRPRRTPKESSEVVAAKPAKKRPTKKHYKSQQHKSTTNKTGKVKFICFMHAKYGKDAFDCADRKNCTWSGN